MLGFAGEAIVQCIDVSFCIFSAQLAEGEGSKMFPSPILKTNIVVGKKRLGGQVYRDCVEARRMDGEYGDAGLQVAGRQSQDLCMLMLKRTGS